MITKICPSCKGMKRLMGLGFTDKICNECNGVGRVEDVIADPIFFDEVNELTDVVIGPENIPAAAVDLAEEDEFYTSETIPPHLVETKKKIGRPKGSNKLKK